MMLKTLSGLGEAVGKGGARVLIGTSTPSAKGGAGKGIYISEFHDGRLSEPKLTIAEPSPSFLATTGLPAGPLYTVMGSGGPNSLAAGFRVSADGSMQQLGSASSGGRGGCHVSVSGDGRCVFVANYSGGSVASLAADGKGGLAEATFVQFPPDAHGPVEDRQTQSHAHSALVSPDGDFVFVNDLGLDRIHVFRLDRATAKLTPHKPDHWASAPGAGPRHLVYHPNGKWIYCINEVNSTIDQLQWNSTHGVLTTKSTVGTLPDGVDAKGKRACEMAFSKDMRFLYAANRVHESFAVFALNAETGALTHVQELPNPGEEARHIVVDPSGRWFLSANQFSGDVSVFPIDTKTGRLGERSSQVKVDGASCVLFA